MDFLPLRHCKKTGKNRLSEAALSRLEATKIPQNKSRTGLSCGKQPAPSECFGAGFEISELITRGETKDNGPGTGLNIFFHPIDHFIPRAGNAEHRVCHCLVRPVVVLRKEALSFDNSRFATGSEGKVNSGMNRIRDAARHPPRSRGLSPSSRGTCPDS